MYDFISLFALAALVIVEFVLNLLAHAMALQLAMWHSLIFFLLYLGQVYDTLRSTKVCAHRLLYR